MNIDETLDQLAAASPLSPDDRNRLLRIGLINGRFDLCDVPEASQFVEERVRHDAEDADLVFGFSAEAKIHRQVVDAEARSRLQDAPTRIEGSAIVVGGRHVKADRITAVWQQDSESFSVLRLQVLVSVEGVSEPLSAWSWDLHPKVGRGSPAYQAADKAARTVVAALDEWLGWDVIEPSELCELPDMETYFGPGEFGVEGGWTRGQARARRRLEAKRFRA